MSAVPRGSHMSKDEWEQTQKFRRVLSKRLGYIVWTDIGVECSDEACRIAARDGIDAAIAYANAKFNDLLRGAK